MLDGPGGPVRARLGIEDGELDIVPEGQREGGPTWSLHRGAEGWEGIGSDGAIVRLERRGAAGLVLYTADGRVGVGLPVAPLPRELVGAWVERDPETGEGRPVQVVLGAPDGPARWVVEGATRDAWPLDHGDGAWSLVLQDAVGEARLRHLHRLPEGRWLLYGHTPGRARLLHRPDHPPPWLP